MKPCGQANIRKFKPNKSLGQNFLVNQKVKQQIISACNLAPEDIVLEIGPGRGEMTSEIAKKVKRVIAVEKDKNLAAILTQNFAPPTECHVSEDVGEWRSGRDVARTSQSGENSGDTTVKPRGSTDTNVEIINEDILKFNFTTLPVGIKVIGNLPYYITTPIIEEIVKHSKVIKECFFMVQFEFAERVVAMPGGKEYGSLTLFLQYYCNPKILAKVKNTAFSPKPKVDSCFLKLEIPAEPKYQVKDEKLLFRIIHSAFQQRRKTIMNSMSSVIKKEVLRDILSKLSLSENLRAENLSIEDYIRISDLV